jgi:hypothetical protein
MKNVFLKCASSILEKNPPLQDQEKSQSSLERSEDEDSIEAINDKILQLKPGNKIIS